MDKTKPYENNVKHREGFALMITLSVLAVIIALTMVLLSYFDEVREDASRTKPMIQANVYYADILSMFKKFKKKETIFKTLYLMPVPLQSPDGRFSLMLTCEPLAKGVNINWLGLENKKDIAQELFDWLAGQYNLENPERLREMILEEIGGDKKYVSKEYRRVRQKNGIMSYRQFAAVVSRYQFEVDDEQISRVPWEKYFSFSLTSKKIDIKYSSPELISWLFRIDDIQSVREWQNEVFRESSLREFVNNNGSVNYDERKNLIVGEKAFQEESVCTVQYTLADESYRFKFEYIQGEAKHFEFYTKH